MLPVKLGALERQDGQPMKSIMIVKSIAIFCGILCLAASANKTAITPVVVTEITDNLQVTAIMDMRVALGLPNLPLELKGTDTMINSPSGDLQVAIYTDSEGRKFSVEPTSSTVVEMDARGLLSSIPTNAPVMSQADIKARVAKMLEIAIPDFETISQSLSYEEGGKTDNYFFNWYGNMQVNDVNRPFIQVGVYRTGFIFSYYNTITLPITK